MTKSEAPESADEDAESDEENPEDTDEGVESDEEIPKDTDEGAESSEETPESIDEDAKSGEENPEEVGEDAESGEEGSEGTESDAESGEGNPEGKDEDAESDEEDPEGVDENAGSSEENTEGVDEDAESGEENLEGKDEDAESDEEDPEGMDENAESSEENPEGVDEETESGEENPESVDEDAESGEENLEDEDEEAESGEEALENRDEDPVSVGERHEDQQLTKPNGEKNIKQEGDRGREDIAYDTDGDQREWQSFIGVAEKERPSSVMAMGAGAAASEVAALHREEMRQARNAETPDIHRGETVPTLRKGHEQTIIAATENKLEDNQPPEMFPEAQVEVRTENHLERDYVEESPEQPSTEQEPEKKAVADNGLDVDLDQDAAGQIAQAAQAAAAGLAPGVPGEASGGSGEPEGSQNGPDEPPGVPGASGRARTPSGNGQPIEQKGSRVRVEIPLPTGHQFGSSPIGEALQFGQPLSQLQRLVSQVPIPTNEMQGDAALADMIAQMGIPSMRLGFPNNVVTMEDVRAFRNSRGLRWLRLGDRKSLVLVDASNKTYIQELKEIAEPDEAGPEMKHQIETPDVPKEEFERNLETFNEIEIAEYERQKRFYDFEEGLPFQDRQTLLGDFTCHGMEHVIEVMSEGNRYIDALEKAGIEVPESLRQIYGVAAKYHDIGMADSAGVELARDISEKVKQPDADFSRLEEFFNLDPKATLESTDSRAKELVATAGDDQNKVDAVESMKILQTSVVEAKMVAERLREMPPNDPEKAETELVYRQKLSKIQDFVYDNLRSNHARRSAEYVLNHSNEFKERYGKNVNPRNVACAIMLHTKTNSGCGDLNSLSFGMAEVEQLSVEEACSHLVADWNLNHGDRRVESTFSEADLKEIAFTASLLRIADNRRNGKTATFTNGDRIVYEITEKGPALYHGEESDGTMVKKRKVESAKSVSIISAESCTQFGEIRPENGNMVHVMRFNGLGTVPLEQGFAESRIVDYVGEVESGVFMSRENSVNIIEVQVPKASKADCTRLEQEWTRVLEEFCEKNRGKKKAEAVMQYYQSGRLRVVPTGRKEENL